MKMEQVNEKYNRVLEILRRTKPVLGETDQIEEAVLRKIIHRPKAEASLPELIDFLFAWTYIKWVRRSLVTASVFLVLVFVFQQSIILKQISNLTRQIESYERDASGFSGDYQERRMMLLRFSEKRFPFLKKTDSDKQIEDLFRTIDQLKKEYRDLDRIIEENPELKSLIEKKLSEIDGNKIKI